MNVQQDMNLDISIKFVCGCRLLSHIKMCVIDNDKILRYHLYMIRTQVQLITMNENPSVVISKG